METGNISSTIYAAISLPISAFFLQIFAQSQASPVLLVSHSAASSGAWSG